GFPQCQFTIIRDAFRRAPILYVHFSSGLGWTCCAKSPCFVQGFGSKVLLVNYAVVADQEGPPTLYFVFSGCGDTCKAADHDSLDHKIHFAERRRRALSFQDLEKIPMVRLRSSRIALFNCPGDVLTDRAVPLAIGGLPR